MFYCINAFLDIGDTSSLVFLFLALGGNFPEEKKDIKVVTAKRIRQEKLRSRLSFRYSLLSRPRKIVFKNLVSRCRGLIAETRRGRSQKVERVNSGMDGS